MGFQNTVKKCIVYIGLKYDNIIELRLDRCSDVYESPPASVIPLFEEPVQKAITNMKQLDTYASMIHPLTNVVAAAIDENSNIEWTICAYMSTLIPTNTSWLRFNTQIHQKL